MKKTIIIFLLSCAYVTTYAQLNFVLNGSFEQHRKCPFQPDLIEFANFWNAIDTSWVVESTTTPLPPCMPEYINSCSLLGCCGAPVNGKFYQYPRTGDGMALSEVYYDFSVVGYDFYSYLQGRLNKHLIAGQSYCVTFYVNLANNSSYAVNKIGAYLDDGSIDTTHLCGTPQSQYTPQILDTNLIRDTLNWVKIQGSFIATGTEKFITMGLFFDSSHATIVPTGIGNDDGYYLFDDVSVIASDAVAYAGADTAIRAGDTAHIGAIMNGDGMPCWWYVLGSTTPIDSSGTIRVHPAVTTTYVVMMDLCGNITYDTVKVVVWPSLIMNYELGIINVKVYPNPAADEMTISGAKNCDAVFYDITGRVILQSLINNDKEVINIEGLAKGVYFVEITDKETKEKVTKKLLKE